MRNDIQQTGILNLLKELGAHAKGPGRVYITGGATAVLLGILNANSPLSGNTDWTDLAFL